MNYFGVDVGGSKILAVNADPSTGKILHQVETPTPTSSKDALAVAIGDVVETLIEIGGMPAAIGIGVPGLVDKSGLLRYGPNVPGVFSLDIGHELRSRFGKPVAVDNDATNAARAEHALGAARGYDDAVLVTQGTGIGGGIIVNGKIVRGAHGFAGEPGHMLIDPAGYECACGRIGCWETVSSGAGLRNIAQKLVSAGRGARILELAEGEHSHIRGEHVAQAFAEGDDDAAAVVQEFATWVARGLGSLVSILDPGVIVLGGGVMKFGESFLDSVQEQLLDFSMGFRYREPVPVVPAQLGPAAGAIGGAIIASEVAVGR